MLVARGYNRILPTWQGYFIELEEDDIVEDHLTRDEYPSDGEESWTTPGVKVFKLTRPDNRRTPRAHRFALKTPPDFTGRCNPLSVHKYYIHAYQTRFVDGKQGRSLNSRSMASMLRQMYPEQYQLSPTREGYHYANTNSRGKDTISKPPSAQTPC